MNGIGRGKMALCLAAYLGLATLLTGCGAIRSSERSTASSPLVVVTQSPETSSPGLLLLPAVAYDGVSRHILVFGGQRLSNPPQMSAATWIRGDASWSPVAAQLAPSARIGALATYDPVRRNVVLFGGETDAHQLLADTWTWNGTMWVTQRPTSFPPWIFPQAGNLAFDSARGEALLFGNGGAAPSPTQGPETFTWSWNGTNWTRKNVLVSPPARSGAAMAFDEATDHMLLFGGYQYEGPGGQLGDTWIWDGATWKQAVRSASSPKPGLAYAAYDETRARLWLLTSDGAMWYWSNNNWVLQGMFAAVANRLQAAMVFDAGIGKIVLYGGKVATPATNGQAWTETRKNDLWAWDGFNWTQVG